MPRRQASALRRADSDTGPPLDALLGPGGGELEPAGRAAGHPDAAEQLVGAGRVYSPAALSSDTPVWLACRGWGTSGMEGI
jgi:hypothetical protein